MSHLAQAAAEYGGPILHLDGLEPEGAQEQLWTVRELFFTRVLVAGWLPRVNEATLTQLLTPVRDYLDCHSWPVLATLSDKQRVLVNVLQTMWSGAPHQWCQGHYLRNAADPLYDYDHALKTDLRRDVRRTIRRSLSQVAAQAQQGDFAPQLVTGLVVVERPLLAEAQPTPAAGSPTVADTPASTLPSACAAETTLPVEQPVEPVPAPWPPLLPAGAAPSTASAAEKPSPTAAEVIQRYAQVIQQALARDGRAPWFLAGLALYDDPQAIADSLARCLQVRPDPYLQLWRATLVTRVQPYALAFERVSMVKPSGKPAVSPACAKSANPCSATAPGCSIAAETGPAVNCTLVWPRCRRRSTGLSGPAGRPDRNSFASCHMDSESVVCYGTARVIEDLEERTTVLNAFNRYFRPDIEGLSAERVAGCAAIEIAVSEMTGWRERDRKLTCWRYRF
jgi:hypothetical protein